MLEEVGPVQFIVIGYIKRAYRYKEVLTTNDKVDISFVNPTHNIIGTFKESSA